MSSSSSSLSLSSSSAEEAGIVRRIACIGAGYVGGPTMSMIARHNPNIEVYVLDINQERIDAWNSEVLPIFEPGLAEVVFETRGKNLFFSSDLAGILPDSDIIFVAVNTPTKNYGVGEKYAAELKNIEATARMLSKVLNPGFHVIVEKSTVPVRTSEILEKILISNAGSSVQTAVLNNPEFLAEGTAIRDLSLPDRVLIGAPETPLGQKALEMLSNVYAAWVPRDRIISSNQFSSEMTKLVANAFLAQRISSINSVSVICERFGADVGEVSRAVGMDSRIGSKFLNASVGFGGSCFQKDILNLVYLCRVGGLDEVADYWEQVVRMNDFQRARFSRTLIRSLFDTVCGKKIAILGFAFKKDTGDTRESASIFIASNLVSERARVAIYDPKVLSKHMFMEIEERRGIEYPSNLRLEEYITHFDDPYEACKDADAVCVLTEWDEFKSLDWNRIYDSMEKPAFLFEGRRILDPKAMENIGFHVYFIGRPPVGDYIKPIMSL